MAEEFSERDLFGDPVAARREGPGRPEAVWSREGSNKALLAFALGKTVQFAARLVGLSVPTFRKVYFSEVAKRKLARDRMEFRQLELLAVEAEKGNVGASKELDRRMHALRMRDQADEIRKPDKAQAPKKGKKEQRLEAARYAGAGDESWGGLLNQSEAPQAH